MRGIESNEASKKDGRRPRMVRADGPRLTIKHPAKLIQIDFHIPAILALDLGFKLSKFFAARFGPIHVMNA